MKLIISLMCLPFCFATNLPVVLQSVWKGFVDRNQYQHPFLIHRPYSETPGDAVSEGIGYGLILALYNNDQANFNNLLQGAEQTMWNGQCYDWRVGSDNRRMSNGGATDAEQDIAAMLIMAQSKVNCGNWSDYQSGFYGNRAQIILDNFWTQGVTWSHIVRPGYYWGGDDFVNVGYFAPAWYRIFNQFDNQHRNWLGVVDKSYEILSNSPGYALGIVPDWMTPNGQFTSGLGYNAYGDGHYMYKDAIRTLWRIGTDYLWYGDNRALQYLQNAYNFLAAAHGGIGGANFFQMDGSLIPSQDIWYFDAGQRQRHRQEHSPLTIGMWSIPIKICGNESQIATAMEEMLCFYQPNNTYWGLEENPWNPSEDIYHNEMYFEQFLASFGALILDDLWVNYY